jgi:hypothetical protein
MVIVNNSICALLGFPYPEKMARSIPAFEYDKLCFDIFLHGTLRLIGNRPFQLS